MHRGNSSLKNNHFIHVHERDHPISRHRRPTRVEPYSNELMSVQAPTSQAPQLASNSVKLHAKPISFPLLLPSTLLLNCKQTTSLRAWLPMASRILCPAGRALVRTNLHSVQCRAFSQSRTLAQEATATPVRRPVGAFRGG